MDPNKMPGGSNRHYAGKEDAPPSYSEAMQGQPSPHISYTPAPSAPTLESSISTNVYPKNEPPHFPQTDTSHSLAVNYLDAQKWDNRAARMLVMNRLQMQEKFDNAKTEAEREVLWNMLLNQLLGYGYNFSVIDLINFWEFQFEIYKSIVKNLQSGASSGTEWEFFEPMNRVFAHYDVSGSADAVPSSSTSILSNTPIPVIVPIPMPLPATGPNQFLGYSEVPQSITQSNSEVPSAPLLAASTDQTTYSMSPAANAANQIPQMNPSLSADSLSSTNLNKEDQQPITTQPESSFIPKFIEENDAEPVVTTQPTFMQTMPPETTTPNNRRNNDGCCSGDPDCYPIFCFSCHDDYHYHHSYTNDSCCDEGGCCDCSGGGGCCDGGGGCCDGTDDTGCCDGADGDGCGDLDCGGCDGC
ncbi:uncharacterized protein LOC100680492 [Nasonia vitripennis]|uniref:Uncharacterized protein n=1 Tax=Nasonia vitripennis TaxID=7425 RepID=A0A7M7T7R3_NASVI|nr:uncharacterized protein LOC100680492 [Nasonia vitripennis]